MRHPQALFAGFVEANATCMSRYKESGATATLAVSVGWELLVASVGDSLAYLDTGSEIVQVRRGDTTTLLVGDLLAYLDTGSEIVQVRGGDTTTLPVGWELLVASVGDSLAYLDTGSEIVQVRGGIPLPCLSETPWPTWTPARRSYR